MTDRSIGPRAWGDRRSFAVALVALLAMVAWPTGRSEAGGVVESVWLERAFDSTRIGRAVGQGGVLADPVVKWRYFLGGVADDAQLETVELNDDPTTRESVVLQSGRAMALSASGELIWGSPWLGLDTLWGVRDLDGDGAAEVIASGSERLLLLDASSGQILFEIGLMGPGVQVVNLDADPELELLVGRDPTGDGGLRAFDFSSGVAAGQLKWQALSMPGPGGFAVAVGDVDGEPGSFEVVFGDPEGSQVIVLDGASGEAAEASPAMGVTPSCGFSQAVDLNGAGAAEVLMLGTGQGGDAYLAAMDAGDGPLWSLNFGGGAQAMGWPGVARDMTGDGALNVAVSVFDGASGGGLAGRWAALVVQGSDGQLIEGFDDEVVVGVADIDGDGDGEVITMGAAGRRLPDVGALKVRSFEGGAFEVMMEVPAAAVVPRAGPMAPCTQRPAGIWDEGIGNAREHVLIMVDQDDDGFVDTLRDLGGGEQAPSVALEPGQRFERLQAASGGPLRLQSNDGFLVELSVGLEELSRVQLGGFLGEPRVILWNDQPMNEEEEVVRNPWVLLQDSRRRLLFLDPLGAEQGDGPMIGWQGLNSVDQFVFAMPWFDEPGRYLPVRLNAAGGELELEQLQLDGMPRWTRTLTGATGLPFAFISAQYVGSEQWDVVYAVEQGDAVVLELLDGDDGALRASATLEGVAPGDELALLKIPDRTGDFVDDMILMTEASSWLISGETLMAVRELPCGPDALHSSVVNLGGEASDVLVCNASTGAKSSVAASGAVDWELSFGPEHPWHGYRMNYPGYTRPDTESSHFNVAFAGPIGDILLVDGRDGAPIWRVCLEEGGVEVLSAEQELTAESCGGVPLSDITGVEDLDGDAGEEFVVGSADGWLYTLNAESGTLVWSYFVGGALGAPVVADIGRDNQMSILVSSSDGFVYTFGAAELQAVPELRDVAVRNGEVSEPGTDIDAKTTNRSLGYAWEAVPGVTSYSLQILDEAGNMVAERSMPSSQTSVAVTGLNLQVGVRYRGQIEPQSVGMVGPRTESDGVLIQDDAAPEIANFEVAPPLVTAATEEPLAFTAELSDNIGLRALTLTMTRDGDGAPVYEVSRQLQGARNATLAEMAADEDLLAPLEDGAYTATLTVSDQGGNEATATAEVTVARTPPPAPIVVEPADGALLADASPDVTGTAPSGVSLSVFVDDALACALDVGEDGAFTCALEEALEDGEHVAYAEAEDEVGNTSASEPHTFTVDTTPPDPPVITAPVDGDSFDVANVKIEGTAEAGASVTVQVVGADEALCELEASEEGLFDCDVTFEDGSWTIVATAADGLGNLSEPSAEVGFTVQTVIDEPDTGMMDPDTGMMEEDTGGMVEEDSGKVEPDAVDDSGVDVATGSADDGCACAVPSQPAPSPAAPLWLALFGIGAAVALRRR